VPRRGERSMTDEEIGLVKAMLDRGFKNDQAHFYFNRIDRLVSSGRITQIKQGEYGARVAAASAVELDTFLERWAALRSAENGAGALSPDHSRIIISLFERGEPHWIMRTEETHRAECKQAFRLKPEQNFGDAVKTIAAFANNCGGYLLFGVHNGTRAAQGLAGDFFANADPAEINRLLAGALDPVPTVNKFSVQLGTATIGVLHVEKHEAAPVIALKVIGDAVKEGAIYYRYVGESRSIKPGELRQIIAERERKAVADFSRRMSQVAAGTIATLDPETGEVRGKAGTFVIDRALLPEIQFIREGEFDEVRGKPALKLVGEVKPVDASEEKRVRTIRDAVTPDAIIRNFLRQEKVAEPMQYIHAQAHYQQRWMPVWFYVEQTGLLIEAIVEDMRSQVSTRPASRTALIARLKRADEAYKVHPGSPITLCRQLQEGSACEIVSTQDISRFASAVAGLKDGAPNLDSLRNMLLTCLDRSLGETPGDGARRSLIFRASCRLDELLHREACMRVAN
jgi:hypothetical protein